MKNTRLVVCVFCGVTVLRKTLQFHFADECEWVPELTGTQHICSLCQKPKEKHEFPASKYKPLGYDHRCKACHLANYHEYRKQLKTGEATRPATPLTRPSRWVLKPCPYCAEVFSYNQLVIHQRRCSKAPASRRKLHPKDTLRGAAEAQSERLNTSHARLQKSRNLVNQYGITLVEYERMVVAQDGRCAICNKAPGNTNPQIGGLHVDHDHRTGAVRGLLCHSCNHMIGNCKEDPGLLAQAIDYLLHHNPAPGIE